MDQGIKRARMPLQILSVDYRSDITDLKMRLGDQNYMRCKMLHEKRGEEGRRERREGNVRGLERERDKGEESEDEDANADANART